MSPITLATVRIQRAYSLSGVMRDFRVFLDDRQVDRVKNGATIDLRMAPGIHSFLVKLDFYRSKLVTLELAAGEVATLHCGLTSGLSGFMSALVSLDSYVYLKQEDGAEAGSLAPRPAASPTPPSQGLPVDAMGVSLSERIERIAAASEEVRVPLGVTVTVKRARTFEHTVDIDWSVGGSLSVDGGIKAVLSGSIRGEISRKQGTGEKESETVEYEIELKGDSSREYRLVWTDVWRFGLAEVQTGRAKHALPFRYREKTELEVIPVGASVP